jgi:hypothetical protein
MALAVEDRAEESTHAQPTKSSTPSEVFRSWAEKYPLIAILRKSGKPLALEPQRAEFEAKNGKPDIFRVTIIKLKKEGHCTLRRREIDLDEEIPVGLLTQIAKDGQSEWATIRLKERIISAHRKSLTKALGELGYIQEPSKPTKA